MSQRTVWTCDLCGKDIPRADVHTFPSMAVASTLTTTIDVGSCCLQQPIERLIQMFAARSKNTKVAAAP